MPSYQAVMASDNIYAHCSPDEFLRGPNNDSDHFYRLLFQDMGWPGLNLIQLKDEQATAENEQETLLRMYRQTKAGSRVVNLHSSHGTNNPDPTQRDGMQELLCCYDLKEENGLWVSGFISAKWIGTVLLPALHPQATADILLDCCNAPEGDQLKALSRTYNRVKWLPRSEKGVPVKPKSVETVQGMIPPNVALFCACQPNETSCDAYIDNEFQGAFTAGFLRSVAQGKSRANIIADTRKWLAQNGYKQTAHLYCGPAMAQGTFWE